MSASARIAAALARVVDPELGVDIVALGLVYGISPDEPEVRISMATTSTACPMSELLLEGAARAAAGACPGTRVTVEYAVDPPWSPAMMDASAQRRFSRLG